MKHQAPYKLPKAMITGTATKPDAVTHMMLCGWQYERVIDRGMASNAALWNRCAMQCSSPSIVIMGESARPTRRQLEIFYGLFEQGFYLVIGSGVEFFGFKKQLLQQIGPFNEDKGLADMLFRMWEGDFAIADIPMEISTGNSLRNKKTIWGNDIEKKKTLQKWDIRKEVCERAEAEPDYKYNFGRGPNCSRLPWSFSRFGETTKYFSEILLPRNGEGHHKKLADVSVLKAHRKFLDK